MHSKYFNSETEKPKTLSNYIGGQDLHRELSAALGSFISLVDAESEFLN